MSITRNSSINFTIAGLWDNELYGIRGAFAADEYMEADSTTDAPHHGGTAVLHSTKTYLMQNRNLDFMIDGGWELTWEWESGDFTEAEVDDFIATFPMPSQWTTTKDFANHKIVSTCSDTNYQISNWTSREPAYYLKSDKRKLKCTSAGDYYCLQIRNGNWANYTVEVRTVEPNGGNLTVSKAGTTCYILPLRDLTHNSNTLTSGVVYALNSSSISVTNSNTERAKIVRIYK